MCVCVYVCVGARERERERFCVAALKSERLLFALLHSDSVDDIRGVVCRCRCRDCIYMKLRLI